MDRKGNGRGWRGRLSRGGRVLAGAAVSLGFLWLAFRGVSWGELWATARGADPWLLGVALGSVLLATWARAMRWRLTFSAPDHRLPRRPFFTALLAGQALNAAIPARVGELARAYLIGASAGVSRVYALWSVVAEKVLDTLTLLLALACLAGWEGLPPWLRQAGWTLAGLTVAALAGLAALVARRQGVLSWLARREAAGDLWRRLRLRRLVQAAAEGWALLRQLPRLGGLAAWSVGGFVASAGTHWLVGRALHLPVPWAAAWLLLVILQISAVAPIPTSPGRAGLFHYLCVLALAPFGIARGAALSYGLVLHLLVYLPMAVAGPWVLWREGGDPRRLIALWRAPSAAEADQPDFSRRA